MNPLVRRRLAAGTLLAVMLPAVAWASTGGGGLCGLCQLLGLGCCP